jgi:hypothetical protein
MKLLSGEFPSSEEPGLRVFVPREEYLFAMKCRAMRLVTSVIDLAANLRIDVCATTEILRDRETAEARGLVERFEWHYTPKHGSWLDMAESELSVLSGQCLDRRIADKPTLIEEVAAWEESRNQKHVKADWQFTTADARVKLKRLYPAL